jgi:glycosyltransferase involved in cell wall biosynthesis
MEQSKPPLAPRKKRTVPPAEAVAIQAPASESGQVPVPKDTQEPAEEFRRHPVQAMLQSALRALELECEASGKQNHLELLRAQMIVPMLKGTAAPSLSDLAVEHGLTEKEVASRLLVARRAYQRLLRAEISKLDPTALGLTPGRTEAHKVGFILPSPANPVQAFMVAPPWFFRSLAAEMAGERKMEAGRSVSEASVGRLESALEKWCGDMMTAARKAECPRKVQMLAFSECSFQAIKGELGDSFELSDTSVERLTEDPGREARPAHKIAQDLFQDAARDQGRGLRPDPSLRERAAVQGIPALYLPTRGPDSTGMACAFYLAARNKHLDEQPFDVLCADSLESALLALALRRQGYARKVVYVAHQLLRHLVHWAGRANQAHLDQEAQVLQQADAIVLLNETQARNFQTYYAARPAQTIKIIGTGLPFTLNSESQSATTSPLSPQEPIIQQEQTPQGEFCLGAAAAFCTESDYESLAYALRQMANAGSVRLLIAGDASANPEWHRDFLRLTADLGVLEYIEWAGWVRHRDMPAFYQKCHLTVVPSVADTVGLCGLESLQVGVPVIASDSAGLLPEILARINREAGDVTRNPAGAVVPKRSPWALAEAATTLHRHQAELSKENLIRWRNDLRTRVRPVLESYSWSHVALEYEHLFAGLFDPNETAELLRRQQTNLVRDRLQQRMQARKISFKNLALLLGKSRESIRRIFDQTTTRVVRWGTFKGLMEKLDYSEGEIEAMRKDYEREG